MQMGRHALVAFEVVLERQFPTDCHAVVERTMGSYKMSVIIQNEFIGAYLANLCHLFHGLAISTFIKPVKHLTQVLFRTRQIFGDMILDFDTAICSNATCEFVGKICWGELLAIRVDL